MSGGGEDGTLMEVQEGSKQTKFEDLPLAEVVHCLCSASDCKPLIYCS